MHPAHDRFLAEFVKDCLSQEVQTICSSYLAGAKAGVKKDRAILAWLQEAVIGEISKNKLTKLQRWDSQDTCWIERLQMRQIAG